MIDILTPIILVKKKLFYWNIVVTCDAGQQELGLGCISKLLWPLNCQGKILENETLNLTGSSIQKQSTVKNPLFLIVQKLVGREIASIICPRTSLDRKQLSLVIQEGQMVDQGNMKEEMGKIKNQEYT